MPLSRRSLIQSVPAAFAASFHIHARSQEVRQIWCTGNRAIDKPLEIAVKLLKPTQAPHEHAWELHFGSVVFESYG
jgi:membrane dipeptidase